MFAFAAGFFTAVLAAAGAGFFAAFVVFLTSLAALKLKRLRFELRTSSAIQFIRKIQKRKYPPSYTAPGSEIAYLSINATGTYRIACSR